MDLSTDALPEDWLMATGELYLTSGTPQNLTPDERAKFKDMIYAVQDQLATSDGCIDPDVQAWFLCLTEQMLVDLM